MTNTNYILQIALPSGIKDHFDYLASEWVSVGSRVLVPFGKHQRVGLVIAHLKESSVPIAKLKSIITVLDPEPLLSNDILALCQWTSDYYHHPLGDVCLRALPKRLREGKPITVKKKIATSRPLATESPLKLQSAQQQALDHILSHSGFQVHLLHGITGSGKTEIYLQLIAHVIQQGKQCLVLIPEIGLTPQTLMRFQHRFHHNMVVLHSGLNETERLRAFVAASSGEARIVIGTRSALFTPMPELGAIIVDEEHDSSFKQQEKCRYLARDLACVRAKQRDIPIVLGSATPAFETLHNAMIGRYHWLQLPHRAGNAELPTVQIVDCKQHKPTAGITGPLEKAIAATLAAGNQALIFINRRGYAHVLLCASCGNVAECQHCDTAFTVHKQQGLLICHHCDTKRPLLEFCPSCHTGKMRPLGVGTERCEAHLSTLFPNVPVLRIDRDSTRRKGQMEAYLDHIHQGKPLILIGTQMLAKGHHFPNVTLVGIVDADTGFLSSDFRATEKMGQLLMQVAGRAGRQDKKGEVYIQSYQPQHPDLRLLIDQGYLPFAKHLITERQSAGWPPFASIAMIRVRAKQLSQTTGLLETIKQAALDLNQPAIRLFGPIPAVKEKKANQYHGHLLFHAHKRAALQEFLRLLLPRIYAIKYPAGLHWSVDVDPMEVIQ